MAKVLLVEDDNNLREIYEARLQAEGYDIASAKDGEEALVVAKETKPDLIISDVMMPKISGFEMLDILRNTAGLKEAKIIMLTALGQAEDQNRANLLGADKYLVKSQVTLEDIVKVSHELLGDNVEPESSNTTVSNSSSVEPPTVPEPSTPVTPEPMAVEPQNTPVPDPGINNATTQQATPQPEPSDTTNEEHTEQINIDPTGQLTQTEAQETEQMDHTIQEFLNNTSTVEGPSNQSNDQPLIAQSQSTTNQVANDQTLAQAVNDLMSGNDNSESLDTTNNGQPSLQTVPSPPASINNTSQSTNQSMPSSVEISGKKVINPINQEPKKSFEELVAQEEASSIINPNENQINKPFNPDDPNNIAI